MYGQRWLKTKPGRGTLLNPNHPLAAPLRLYALLAFNEGGGPFQDRAPFRRATTIGSADTWVSTPVGWGVNYAGVSDGSTIALDLSDTAIVTVEVLALWNAFANNDLLLFEHTPNFNTNTPAFVANPNGSSSGAFELAISGYTGGISYTSGNIPRPTAGVFHHYLIVFNMTASTIAAWIDGVAQTYTPVNVGNGTPPAAYRNDTLFLMSRGGASLFGIGQLAKVAVYKSALTQAHAIALAREPWIYMNRRALHPSM